MTWRPSWEYPLFKREFVGLLRTRKAFWLLVLTVAISSLVTLLSWPSGRTLVFGQETVWVFYAFFAAQLTVALIVVPAFTAGAISGERERKTYESLYSTLLTPSAIVLAKIFASAGYVVILLLSTAPAICVLYLLGGVGFGAVLRCYTITFSAVLTAGVVCLVISMRSQRTAPAVVRGVGWVFLWNGGFLFLFYLVAALTNFFLFRLPDQLAMLACCLSPYTPISFELFSQTLGMGMGFGPMLFVEPWLIYVIFAMLLSLAHFVYLLRRARKPDLAVSRRRERKLAGKRMASRPPRRSWSTKLLIEREGRGPSWIWNPVFLKELRSEFFGQPRFRRALFWGTLVILTAVACIELRRHDAADRIPVVAGVGLSLVLLLLPGVAASSFSRELEQGNLDFLRGTLLTLRQVLQGKFAATLYSCFGVFVGVLWVSAGLLLFYSPRTYMGDTYTRETYLGAIWVFGATLAILLMTLVFTAAVGTFASVISKRTLGALLVSYLSILAVYLGWPILVMVASSGSGDEVVCATNPYGALAAAYGLLRHARAGEAFFYVSIFLLLHAVAIAVLWGVSAACLEAKRARDS